MSSNTYIIQRGDTLSAIAQGFNTTVATLEALNPGIDPNNLQIGQSIRILIGGGGGQSVQKYTIKQGDTFFSIAAAFNISVDSLEAANPGVQPTQLSIGQVINVPLPGNPPSGSPPVSTGGKVNYSGPASNFPDPSTWASWNLLWAQNRRLMKSNDSDEIIGLIVSFTTQVAQESGVDARAILCIIMQASGGNPSANTTTHPVRNAGLMQSHNGVSFNPNDPAGSILQMIRDGTEGTSDGPGLKQLLAQYGNYYSAFRAYNSGAVDPNDLSDGLGATPDYVSSVANRLMGHTWDNM